MTPCCSTEYPPSRRNTARRWLAVATVLAISAACGGGSSGGSAPAPAPPPVTAQNVTVSWTPPTQNSDGSPLLNLARYRIYYGNSPANLSSNITVDNPGLASFVVEGLQPGTYYFVVRAVSAADIESVNSNTAQIVLQ